jgi:hypothetical protein
VAWLLEEGPADADGETLTDAVEQFGVEEDAASRILEAEFKSAARQVCRCVWLDVALLWACVLWCVVECGSSVGVYVCACGDDTAEPTTNPTTPPITPHSNLNRFAWT